MSINHPTSPIGIFTCLRTHRGLVWELVKRDFVGRYKGSIMGVAWSLFHPLLLLVTYTFVFSVAFKARWGVGEESKVAFALILFAGMMVHGLFAECLNGAPYLIISHPNYVKKVIFPLEILPWVILCSAVLHFSVNLALLLVFCVFSGIALHVTLIFIPVIMLPILLIALGLTWLFASLGVYLRDIGQGMSIVITMLLFLSPVLYPVSILPASYQKLILLNPLTLPIEQIRDVMLFGHPINWSGWADSFVIGCVIAYLGFWWFQKSRRGFADVI